MKGLRSFLNEATLRVKDVKKDVKKDYMGYLPMFKKVLKGTKYNDGTLTSDDYDGSVFGQFWNKDDEDYPTIEFNFQQDDWNEDDETVNLAWQFQGPGSADLEDSKRVIVSKVPKEIEKIMKDYVKKHVK